MRDATNPAELRRRAAVLYRESRAATDPTLARLLMIRSLRMAAQAGALEDKTTIVREAA